MAAKACFSPEKSSILAATEQINQNSASQLTIGLSIKLQQTDRQKFVGFKVIQSSAEVPLYASRAITELSSSKGQVNRTVSCDLIILQ